MGQKTRITAQYTSPEAIKYLSAFILKLRVKPYIIFIFAENFKMSEVLATNRLQSIQTAIKSDSSGDLSSKNNKERIKQFKNLSLKGSTLMQHLFSHRTTKNIKVESSTEFHSRKWDFEPVLQKSQKDVLKGSCNLGKENPFFRAKQSHLKKQQVSQSSGSSQKYAGDPYIDSELFNEKTTFRLLKKGSLNEPLNSSQRKIQ